MARAVKGLDTAATLSGSAATSNRLCRYVFYLAACLYSTSSDTIDPDAVYMAERFAAHASLALGHARREEQLSTALLTRKVIGQAIGILMERHDLDEDGAFSYLTRVSSHTNIKLRAVAQEIVDLRNDVSTTRDTRPSHGSPAVRTHPRRPACRAMHPFDSAGQLRASRDTAPVGPEIRPMQDAKVLG